MAPYNFCSRACAHRLVLQPVSRLPCTNVLQTGVQSTTMLASLECNKLDVSSGGILVKSRSRKGALKCKGLAGPSAHNYKIPNINVATFDLLDLHLFTSIIILGPYM